MSPAACLAPGLWGVLLGQVVNAWRYIGRGGICGAGAGLLLSLMELLALQPPDLEPALGLALACIISAGALLGGALLGAAFWLLRRVGEILSRRSGRGEGSAIFYTTLATGLLTLPAALLLASQLATGRQAGVYLGAWSAKIILATLLAVASGGAMAFGLGVARWLIRSPSWIRFLAAALILLLFTAGLFVMDARLYRRLYLYLHAVLLGVYFTSGVLAMLCLGSCLFLRRREWPGRSRTMVGAGILLGLVLLGLGIWGRETLTREQRLRFAALELTTVTTKLLALAPLAAQAADPLFLGAAGGVSPKGRGIASHEVTGANMVWVTVDALRPDHLGSYGYSRPTSPNIDALAARSVRFSLAYCQAPLTCYSIPSLHTGDYLKSTLPMGISAPPTMARILGAQGYTTAAFYNASIFFCDDKKATSYGERRFGFGYTETAHRSAPDLTDRVVRHLQEHRRAGKGKLFLWVHYFDVHEPYRRNERFDFGPRAMDRYDSEIALVDRSVGRLVTALSQLEQPTIFMLTADHGEEFKEHGGNYHGSSLYDEQVRVPLIIGAPGLKPGVVNTPAQLVDVAPTMMRLLGLRIPRSMHGRSLVGELLGRGDPEGTAFSEVHTKKMVRHRDWKLIHDYRRSTYELYDLRGDPGERRNLIGSRPREAAQMKAKLGGWFDSLRRSASGAEGDPRPAGIDLGRIGDRRSVPLLSHLVLDPAASTRWRREAAQLLGQIQDRRAAGALWGAVADGDRRVAAEAAIALGEMKDRRARLVLPTVLGNTDDDLRMRGAIAMARVDSPAATPALVETLYSNNWELQNRAAHYLGFLGDRRAVEPLLRMAHMGHLRSRVALSLGRLGRRIKDSRIMPYLLGLARNDRKVDTRQRALAGLGYLGDRRAVRTLAGMVGKNPDLTWLPETLSRLGGIGGALPGLDINPGRKGLRRGWGACTRDTSVSSKRYLASTWCAVTSERASLDIFTRRRPRGGRLQIHLRPLGPVTHPVRLALRLNGRALEPALLTGGWQVHDLSAPAKYWRRGRNRLELVMQPSSSGSDGAALAVDWVLLAPESGLSKDKKVKGTSG